MKKLQYLIFSFLLVSCSNISNDSSHERTTAAKRRGTIKKGTRDKISCFPKRLNGLLKQISRAFGRPVLILSGFRSRADNKRRKGAKNSLHIKCLAADFTVPGVKAKKVGKYLARMKNRGGAGFYCGNRFHIDVGGRRSWGGCKSSYISYESGQKGLKFDAKLNKYPNYKGEVVYDAASRLDSGEDHGKLDYHDHSVNESGERDEATIEYYESEYYGNLKFI